MLNRKRKAICNRWQSRFLVPILISSLYFLQSQVSFAAPMLLDGNRHDSVFGIEFSTPWPIAKYFLIDKVHFNPDGTLAPYTKRYFVNNSFPVAINDEGWIAGMYLMPGGVSTVPGIIYSIGAGSDVPLSSWHPLPLRIHGEGVDLNNPSIYFNGLDNDGYIVGSSYNPGMGQRPILWKKNEAVYALGSTAGPEGVNCPSNAVRSAVASSGIISMIGYHAITSAAIANPPPDSFDLENKLLVVGNCSRGAPLVWTISPENEFAPNPPKANVGTVESLPLPVVPNFVKAEVAGVNKYGQVFLNVQSGDAYLPFVSEKFYVQGHWKWKTRSLLTQQKSLQTRDFSPLIEGVQNSLIINGVNDEGEFVGRIDYKDSTGAAIAEPFVYLEGPGYIPLREVVSSAKIGGKTLDSVSGITNSGLMLSLASGGATGGTSSFVLQQPQYELSVLTTGSNIPIPEDVPHCTDCDNLFTKYPNPKRLAYGNDGILNSQCRAAVGWEGKNIENMEGDDGRPMVWTVYPDSLLVRTTANGADGLLNVLSVDHNGQESYGKFSALYAWGGKCADLSSPAVYLGAGEGSIKIGLLGIYNAPATALGDADTFTGAIAFDSRVFSDRTFRLQHLAPRNSGFYLRRVVEIIPVSAPSYPYGAFKFVANKLDQNGNWERVGDALREYTVLISQDLLNVGSSQ